MTASFVVHQPSTRQPDPSFDSNTNLLPVCNTLLNQCPFIADGHLRISDCYFAFQEHPRVRRGSLVPYDAT